MRAQVGHIAEEIPDKIARGRIFVETGSEAYTEGIPYTTHVELSPWFESPST